MTMRVVHIINNLPVGGAERFLLQLAQAQAGQGCAPSILTLVEPNPLADVCRQRGLEYRCLGRTRLNEPRLLFDVWRELRALRPDVVHTHLFYGDTFGSIGARAAGVRAVLSTQHSTARGRLSWKRRAGLQTMARFAHRIVAVSDPVRHSAAAHLRVPESDIDVIPNGIVLDEWSGTSPDTLRAELAVGADSLIVACVGRVIESKRYDVLLDAIARLEQYDLHVLIVGDGPERPRLEAHAARLGLADTVRWLGTRDDVPRILANSNVFVLPSQWEGHSVALLEAMASGCACVISDIPELASAAGDAALRVRPGDADALAKTLRDLLNDPQRRVVLGEAGRRTAADFSIDTSAERYMRVYRDLLSGN